MSKAFSAGTWGDPEQIRRGASQREQQGSCASGGTSGGCGLPVRSSRNPWSGCTTTSSRTGIFTLRGGERGG